MKNIFILAKKELSFYLNNPLGYIIGSVFLIVSTFFFFNNFFLVSILSVKQFFELVPWFLLFLVAGLTMRSFAEERRNNTLEVLMSTPLSEAQMVLGKCAGVMWYVCILFLLFLVIPLSLHIFGTPPWGEVLVGFFGLIFYSALLTSVGVFFSLLTKNQVVALLMTLMTYLLFMVIGTDAFTRYAGPTLADILVYFSPMYHLNVFVRGVVAFRSVIYFMSITSVMLILSTIFLQKKD